MKRSSLFLILIIVAVCELSVAQTSGSITVGGDLDKFYPVTWNDYNWANNKRSEVFIGRSNVHTDGTWHGSLMSHFTYHTTNWGNGSSFIDATIRYVINPFVAGWRDATVQNGNNVIIIWLRGSSTYYYSSDGNVSPTVYLTTYNETNGPSHTYKTAIDPYVNSYGPSFQDVVVNGNLGIGTNSPQQKLHISGTGDVSPIIEATDDGFASINFRGNGKTWQWSKRPGAAADAIQLYYHNGTSWTGPFLAAQTNGNIGIGTQSPDAKLAVKGIVHAEEIKVDLSVPWPDYIFEPDYKLQSLESIASYIKSNKHLPDVPSAKEVEENGVNLGEMNKILLQKIEELTLYVIELKKENNDIKEKLEKLIR